tara:strand:- start:471 stop:932 length:462 start_codon:yes stop_codon:yes gene_type:complete
MSTRPYKSKIKTDQDIILNKAIGKRIKAARENYYIYVKEIVDGEFKGTYKPVKKLITQTRLAKAVDVTFQQIQKYEKGTNGLSAIKLLKISNFFNKPLDYFISDAMQNFPMLNKIYLGKLELSGQYNPPDNNFNSFSRKTNEVKTSDYNNSEG